MYRKEPIVFVVRRMPDSCKECSAPDPYGLRCTLTGSPASGNSRPDDCPLRQVRCLTPGRDDP